MAKQVIKKTVVAKAPVKKVMVTPAAKKTVKSVPVKNATQVSNKTVANISKGGYGQKQYSDDSVKVRKSLSTMDSIDKETDKNLYIPALKGKFMNDGDDIKRKTAQDSLMSAGKRMMAFDSKKKK